MTERAGPDLRARRRLRIARQAFRRGEHATTIAASDADRVAAVVQIDFAVETVLRAVLFDRDRRVARSDRFSELLDHAGTAVYGGGLPRRSELEHVRSIRNAAQHEARVPTAVEAIECLVHARDALGLLAESAWGVDFLAGDIDEIRSEKVRGHLTRAHAAVAANNGTEAMGWLRAAFHFAFNHGGENLVGPAVDVDELIVRERRRKDTSDPFGKGRDAAVALRRLQVLGRLLAFGISVGDYLHWRQELMQAPALNLNGELIRHESERSWTEREVDTATAFVVDATLRIEHVVPDVDPGGFRRGGFETL